MKKVKMLRDRKANMWLRNAKGDLPLHEAASSGRRELVLWLLDQRPKHVNTTSNDGRTILHIAAANDYTDMCKVIEANTFTTFIYSFSFEMSNIEWNCI